jgi:hypothetical protein
MKTILFSLLLGIMCIGCKTTEITPDSAYKAGSSAGLATAYIVKLSNIDEQSQHVIVSITSELSNIIPTNTQTFIEVWNPIIEKRISAYIEKQTLNNKQKQLIELTFDIVVEAIDHFFVKNAKFKLNTDIAFSAINGFCTSFNSLMIPSKTFASKITYDVDSEMYMYLKYKFAK